jgi:predicted NAD/FAD-dependent oxidoreductase
VLHASPDWSREHLEADTDDVAGRLLTVFAATAGVVLPSPAQVLIHRWRQAFVERPLGRAFAIDPEIVAGACGDWCIGPRAEAAFDSGRALARALLSAMGLAAAPVGR